MTETKSGTTRYQVTARNYSTSSENRIHSDDIAQRYGFRGALVPGVAVYGYMTHPLVERFGEAWLGHATSNLRLAKPAYDGDALTIDLDATDDGYTCRCHNADGLLLAEVSGALTVAEPGSQAVFEAEAKPEGRPEMSWESIVENEPFRPWHRQITEDDNRTFTERVADDLPVYRTAAHPHWLLGIANRALTREYVMPAWIHVGSEVRSHALLKVGDTVEIRTVPLEKWERKGHQFVKLYLVYLRDGRVAMEIFHTAIFRVAG